MAILAWQAEEKTIYKSEERISRIEIFYCLFKWYLKYNEINRRFFDYGMDRKEGHNRDQILGYKKFKQLRDSKNYNPVVRKDLDYNYLCLVRDKFVFAKYMSGFSIPVINNLAIFNKKKLRCLHSNKIYKTVRYFTSKSKVVNGFCKPVDGGKGKGAFSLTLINGKIIINNKEVSFDQLSDKCVGNYLFQEKIVQHAAIQKIYPFSVNSLRIVTFYNDGKPELFLGAFRTGTGGRIVDNVSAGGIAVGINLKSGQLYSHGFKNNINKLECIDRHPDTGFYFKGFTIPWFEETIQLLKKAHRWMYGFHSIGWDIAITPEGPIIIEANDQWDGVLYMALNDEFKNFKESFLQYYND